MILLKVAENSSIVFDWHVSEQQIHMPYTQYLKASVPNILLTLFEQRSWYFLLRS